MSVTVPGFRPGHEPGAKKTRRRAPAHTVTGPAYQQELDHALEGLAPAERQAVTEGMIAAEMDAKREAAATMTLRDMAVKVKAFAPLALRRWFHTHSWPLRRRWWKLLCALNQHDDREAYDVLKNSDPDLSKPGRFHRCQRPECQRYRETPQLVETATMAETRDFMVLCYKNCKQCFGRGYHGKVLLGDGKTASKRPCSCLVIQPIYIEHKAAEGKC
jgi:hypothetical protein